MLVSRKSTFEGISKVDFLIRSAIFYIQLMTTSFIEVLLISGWRCDTSELITIQKLSSIIRLFFATNWVNFRLVPNSLGEIIQIFIFGFEILV